MRRRKLQGATLNYCGRNNPEGLVFARDRYGRMLRPREYNRLIDFPWFWRLNLKVHTPTEIHETEQDTLNAYRLADLGHIIDEAVAELPAVDYIEWEVKVL